jgi:hypothetical protein
MKSSLLTVNTGSSGKRSDFLRYLGNDVQFTDVDLPEPLADPLTIARYKASQFTDVVVDDVGLDIEGEDVGPLIKWRLHELSSWVGRRATYHCYLAVHRNQKIEVFMGSVPGKIVAPRGESYGFNNYFLPNGSSFTLGEQRQDEYTARFLAVQKLISGKPDQLAEPLKTWSGKFQES